MSDDKQPDQETDNTTEIDMASELELPDQLALFGLNSFTGDERRFHRDSDS